MPVTLEAIQRAADSLGLERKTLGHTLLIKVRRKTWLSFHRDGGDVRTGARISGGPPWRVWLLYVGVALAIGNAAVRVLLHHQWGRWGWQQNFIAILLVLGFVGILAELAYSPWQLLKSRRRLLEQAQEKARAS
jgi:hypothetical protein